MPWTRHLLLVSKTRVPASMPHPENYLVVSGDVGWVVGGGTLGVAVGLWSSVLFVVGVCDVILLGELGWWGTGVGRLCVGEVGCNENVGGRGLLVEAERGSGADVVISSRPSPETY